MGATTTNGDGFGVGWYGDRAAPVVFKAIEPAWNDRKPHSLSRLVHQMLVGDRTPHRRIPINEEVPEPAEPSTPAQTRVVYGRDDARRAWAKRRGDLNDLAGIHYVLAEIDARATELKRPTAAVLAQTSHHETDRR